MKYGKYDNKSERKNQDYSQILNAIHDYLFIPWKWEFNKEYECYIPLYKAEENAKQALIPRTFFKHPKNEKKDVDYNKIHKELEWFRTKQRNNTSTWEDYLAAAEQIMDSAPFMLTSFSDGTKKVCESYKKGNKKYYEQQTAVMADWCRKIDAQNTDCVFITVTCDTQNFTIDRATAWENFRALEITPIMENLRKHKHCQYIGVMESTLKGYPHAHILAFFPKGLYPELAKLKNEQSVRKGRLYEYIKSHKHSRMVKIKYVHGKGKIYYLKKYIRKGVESTIHDLLERSGTDYTESEIKQIKEFVCLTAYSKRKLFKTRMPKSLEEESPISPNASVSAKDSTEVEDYSARARRARLEELCINSPLNTTKKVFGLSKKQYKELYGYSPHHKDLITPLDMSDMQINSSLVYDEENFYTLFVKAVQDIENCELNKAWLIMEEPPSAHRFTDEYDISTDRGWMDCLEAMVLYYFKKCLGEGFSIMDVMHVEDNEIELQTPLKPLSNAPFIKRDVAYTCEARKGVLPSEDEIKQRNKEPSGHFEIVAEHHEKQYNPVTKKWENHYWKEERYVQD